MPKKKSKSLGAKELNRLELTVEKRPPKTEKSTKKKIKSKYAFSDSSTKRELALVIILLIGLFLFAYYTLPWVAVFCYFFLGLQLPKFW